MMMAIGFRGRGQLPPEPADGVLSFTGSLRLASLRKTTRLKAASMAACNSHGLQGTHEDSLDILLTVQHES